MERKLCDINNALWENKVTYRSVFIYICRKPLQLIAFVISVYDVIKIYLLCISPVGVLFHGNQFASQWAYKNKHRFIVLFYCKHLVYNNTGVILIYSEGASAKQ